MTCAIAYKDSEGMFTIGVDTCVTGGDYISKHQQDVKYNIFYDENGNNPGVIVFSGRVALFQRILSELNSKDYDRMINSRNKMTIDTLSSFTKKLRNMNIDTEVDGVFEMLIMHEGECFYIDSGFAILEVNDYYAIGNGMPTAMGAIAMADNKNRSPFVVERRILKALRIATKQLTMIEPPYIILSYSKNGFDYDLMIRKFEK